MAKKNFDSEFCGSLPLNYVNLIQDYGYLIVADRKDFQIIQLSENSNELLKYSAEELIGRNLAEFIDQVEFGRIKELAELVTNERTPLQVSFLKDQAKSCLLHVKTDFIILEVEARSSNDKLQVSSVLRNVQRAVMSIEAADSVNSVSEVAIRELKQISGFDGVLMYQFDKDWNGKVIAEEKTADLEAYLGQTFPASDIPKQARELYLKNPYRQIPKRDYDPKSLYPVVNSVTDGFLDLSDCNLRSVPSVHREYMKNMGINASMSIRVLHQGQLWGLISCHHIEPKYIDMEMCALFEVLSAIISNRISIILSSEKLRSSSALAKTRIHIMNQMHHKQDLTSALFDDRENNLLDLLSAGGAVLAADGGIISRGQVPDSNFVDELLLWLDSKNLKDIYYTDNLSEVFEEARSYKEKASGLLAIPLDISRNEYLLCFRPEVQATIDWGGNPNQAITFDADGKNYHPRNSFKMWKEKLDSYSVDWKELELEAARAVGTFLNSYRDTERAN